MKRFSFILILLIIAVSGILIAFSREINNKLHIEKPEVLQNMQAHPIGYLMEEGKVYNVLYPFLNEMEEFAMEDSVTVFNNEASFTLYMDKKDIEGLTYEIINPLTKESLYSNEPSDIIKGEDGVNAEIKLPNLTKSTRYVLKVMAKNGNMNIYYYQSFYIGDNNQKEVLSAIRQIHSFMFEGDKEYKKYIGGEDEGSFYWANKNSSEKVLMWDTVKDYVKMNEPVPEIISYNPSTQAYEIRMRFTVATRKDYEFEYWDFTETYTATAPNGKVKINSFERYGNKKNQPYFDGERLQWVLDQGYEGNESQAILSDSDQYVAFVYKNEVWLLDKTYNEITKVFGFDILDSDYIMDEGDQHRIKLLNIDDKGNIKYLVYGYMASGDFAGYNGILKNTYSHKKLDNEATLFVKLGIGYQELEYYIENASYYNADNEQFYMTIKDELYSIDFAKNNFTKKMELPSNSYYSEDGIIYAYDSKLKENIGVQLIDLTSSKVSVENTKLVMFQNTFTRVIGTIDNGLIIGTYSLKNTYQYLDGSVFYPFDAIMIVDSSGDVIEKLTPEKNTYYQEVSINKQEGLISASTFRLSKNTSANPTASKVTYEKINNRTIYTFNKENHVTPSVLNNEIIEGMNHIFINQSSTSLNEDLVHIATNSRKKYVLLDATLQTENLVYEVYNKNKLIGVGKSIDEALRMTSQNASTILYENTGAQRKAIFSASKQASSIMLEVPIMAQKPELIRGCEVTALAMFLSYYKQENVSKIILSEQLRKDETPKTLVDGMINFGDMHKGFVGSVSNNSQPGLGVYVEPIYDLASTYVDNLYNITGASFDQVLLFVGEGRPVWVITPVNYNKISDRVIQNWLTPSGYMEVSFLEHSVVIVGYDDNYVYLNDPQQGRVIKQPRVAFQVGWENQGSQALVVLN